MFTTTGSNHVPHTEAVCARKGVKRPSAMSRGQSSVALSGKRGGPRTGHSFP